MTKRMLVDATHAEETRVVVMDGNRLEDFDVETSTKRQLKGNIYLAKVVRVEPSLQAAFVEYGGNRHGFLAFSEIHPDYYQIPVADRERLLRMEAEDARREQEEEDRAAAEAAGADPDLPQHPEDEAVPAADQPDSPPASAPVLAGPPSATSDAAETIPADGRPWATGADEIGAQRDDSGAAALPAGIVVESLSGPVEDEGESQGSIPADSHAAVAPAERPRVDAEIAQPEPAELLMQAAPARSVESEAPGLERNEGFAPAIEAREEIAELPPPETVGGEHDAGEDSRERRIQPRFLRSYKIQEVIRRRQILLVQVVKEERGTKGAALTTYLSLAGRYCVLMPNSPRGGGISRKITSPADRRRLKEVMGELDLPQGMGLIVRTAGANRPKPEIKRDCEYLLRLWDDIREHTLRSIAPALIYEEASLIKRAIRDVYSRDIDDIVVDGEESWRSARDFMRMLMPSHVKKVQLWREPAPLFARLGVDAQLDLLMSPTVQLRSGGYLVINQAEALVAIDVNSGRSTRERNIEETALRTNLEAADEVARQLRLRDLAGLIVIDFIDMESKKHNAMVERRLKDALKADRARIQVGHISHFGLLEMSRQRLRPSVAETSFILCPHCGGTGHLRSTESAAVHVLRGIEEEGAKRRAAEAVVHVALPIALYILNHKRDRLASIEERYNLRVTFAGDDTMIAPQFRIERLRAQLAGEAPIAVRAEPTRAAEPEVEEAEPEIIESDVDEEEEGDEEGAGETAEAGNGAAESETGEASDQRRKRRRRRRRGGRREEGEAQPVGEIAPAEVSAEAAADVADAEEEHVEGVPELSDSSENDADRSNGRRRNRRGRSRRRQSDEVMPAIAAPGAEQPDLPPAYAGPTPANPFGRPAFDIFDVMEQAEAQREIRPPRPTLPTMIEPGATAEPVQDITPVAEMPERVTPPRETPPGPAAEAQAAGGAGPEHQQAETSVVEPEPAQTELSHDPEAAFSPTPEPELPGIAPPELGSPKLGSSELGSSELASPELASPELAPGLASTEPTAPEPSGAEPALAESAAAEQPAADGTTAAAPLAANDQGPKSPSEPPAAPAILPIVVGSDQPPAQRKRGWWRR